MTSRGLLRGSLFGLLGLATTVLVACGDDSDVQSSADIAHDVQRVDSFPAADVGLGGGFKASFADDQQTRFAFFNFGSGFSYTAAIEKGAEDRAKALGVELDVFDAQVDPQKQIQQIQSAMTSGKYAGGFVLPVAEGLLCDLGTKEAPAENFLFVVTNAPICGREVNEGEETWAPGSLAFVSSNQEIDKFKAWGEEIQRKNPGPQKVIAVLGLESTGQSRNAVTALGEVEKAHPEFQIIDTVFTDFSSADALQKMQDAVQAHPDVTVVASLYSELTKSTVTVLRQASLDGKVKVYDVGADSTVMPLIASGDVQMTYPYYPQTMGATALQALVDARLGRTPITRVYANSGHAVPDLQGDAPLLFVTKDTLEAFKSANLSEY
jgi:ribose transport system substrate-binding protein